MGGGRQNLWPTGLPSHKSPGKPLRASTQMTSTTHTTGGTSHRKHAPGHERHGAMIRLHVLAHRVEPGNPRPQHDVDQHRQEVVRRAGGIEVRPPASVASAGRLGFRGFCLHEATTLVEEGEDGVAATHDARHHVSGAPPAAHLAQLLLRESGQSNEKRAVGQR